MIYYVNIGHERRTNIPTFRYPPTHNDPKFRARTNEKHPFFARHERRLPEEQFQTESLRTYESETGNTYSATMFPEWIRFETIERQVHDFYETSGSWFVISKRVKEKIEQLEPGVHQYFPVRLLQNDGSDPWNTFYFLNIRRHVFSIDVEKSPHFNWKPIIKTVRPPCLHVLRFDPQSPDIKPNGDVPTLVYKSSVVGSFHLWRERMTYETPPNDGKHPVLKVGDSWARLDPEIFMSKNRYELDREWGFRISTTFKAWLDEVKAIGLNYEYSGCLDTEFDGGAKA